MGRWIKLSAVLATQRALPVSTFTVTSAAKHVTMLQRLVAKLMVTKMTQTIPERLVMNGMVLLRTHIFTVSFKFFWAGAVILRFVHSVAIRSGIASARNNFAGFENFVMGDCRCKKEHKEQKDCGSDQCGCYQSAYFVAVALRSFCCCEHGFFINRIDHDATNGRGNMID